MLLALGQLIVINYLVIAVRDILYKLIFKLYPSAAAKAVIAVNIYTHLARGQVAFYIERIARIVPEFKVEIIPRQRCIKGIRRIAHLK